MPGADNCLIIKNRVDMKLQVVVGCPLEGCRQVGGFVNILLLLLDKELDAKKFIIRGAGRTGAVVPVCTGTERHGILFRVAAAHDQAEITCARFPAIAISAL